MVIEEGRYARNDCGARQKVADFLSRQAAGSLAVNKWGAVEFARPTSPDVSMATLTAAQGAEVDHRV